MEPPPPSSFGTPDCDVFLVVLKNFFLSSNKKSLEGFSLSEFFFPPLTKQVSFAISVNSDIFTNPFCHSGNKGSIFYWLFCLFPVGKKNTTFCKNLCQRCIHLEASGAWGFFVGFFGRFFFFLAFFMLLGFGMLVCCPRMRWVDV